MQKSFINKGFVLTVVVLFIGMSVTPSTGIVIEKSSMLYLGGNTLYVGGSGPGNYSKINDAYDDAKPGDTIFVYSGIYYEYLWIEKTINLIGENEDTTSIIYNHKAISPISIFTSDVIVSGFTLYNPNPNLVIYLDIYPDNNYNFISNCIFYNSPLHFDDGTCGLCLFNSSYNKISNCTFLYNDDEGICLNHGSSHNIVENCVFSRCGDGIEFQNTSYNIIRNCIMKDGEHAGIAITDREPLTSDNNLITNCKIYNNEDFGIFLHNGCNNVIYNCSLENNDCCGISVSGKYSFNNIITNNKISNTTGTFDYGIQIEEFCHDNTFSNNHILNCNIGVGIENNNNQSNCNDNLIYHNNFIDNTVDAYDECTNFWDNGYPTGGNYWDDYTGVDNNGDGIGDTPYNISGGDNKDFYPLMEPWVKEEITVGANGPYYGLINVPIQFYGFAVGGYKPYTWLWDFGDGETSDEQNPTHTYTEAGRYDVVLNVTDSRSNSSSDTTFSWIQTSNSPPSAPSITGQTQGKIDVVYEYKFVSIDPEGNDVCYYIDWGDYTQDKWIGPYPSGVEITRTHWWNKEGTYTIKAKSKDWYHSDSNWSYLDVTMPRNKISVNPLFFQFLERLFERFPTAFPILRQLLGDSSQSLFFF